MSTFTDRCLKYEIFEGFKNMERNSTDVIIEDKVYKISTDQDASYVRELAEYINGAFAPSVSVQQAGKCFSPDHFAYEYGR